MRSVRSISPTRESSVRASRRISTRSSTAHRSPTVLPSRRHVRVAPSRPPNRGVHLYKVWGIVGALISRCFGHVPIGQEIQGLYQDHLCERHWDRASDAYRVKGTASGFCSASGTRHCNPISRISSVMLRFAHPAMVQKNAEAFTVAYPRAKPPVVGWASADPSGLGRMFSGGTTPQLGIARID